jgi:hypothetical protein
MNVKKIISLCGSVIKVAKHCGVDRQVVYYWIKVNNIPIRHWSKLMELNEALSAATIGQACYYKKNEGEVDIKS